MDRPHRRTPIIEGTLIRLQVDRLPGGGDPLPLWLWSSATGLTSEDVDVRWQAFLRRFDIEHLCRTMKQTLGWTRPKLRTPEAGDRWTWIVIAAHTHLPLLRRAAVDLRRPWEKPAGSPRPASAAGSETFARTSPARPVHRNPQYAARGDHPARRTDGPPPAMTGERPFIDQKAPPNETDSDHIRQAHPCRLIRHRPAEVPRPRQSLPVRAGVLLQQDRPDPCGGRLDQFLGRQLLPKPRFAVRQNGHTPARATSASQSDAIECASTRRARSTNASRWARCRAATPAASDRPLVTVPSGSLQPPGPSPRGHSQHDVAAPPASIRFRATTNHLDPRLRSLTRPRPRAALVRVENPSMGSEVETAAHCR